MLKSEIEERKLHENIEVYDHKILPLETKSFAPSYMESVWVSYIQKEHQETEVQ